MNTRTLIAAAVAAAMMSMTISLFAAEQPAAGVAPKSEPIYGYRMMTGQERDQYREKMRNAKSADERQSLREEHQKLMTERATERGVTLPQRGSRGDGAGPGRGPGAGMMGPGNRGAGMGPGRGPGGGMGPGGGRSPASGSDLKK